MSEVLLPPNATAQELALEAATARLGTVQPRVRDVWDADTCPVDLLPWLAWAYSVDEWDAAWSPEQQREAIRRSVSVHRYKGTIGAVREALAALGFEAVVQEWFKQEPEGDPYTFRLLLDVSQSPLDQEALARITDVALATKNLRSHLADVVPSLTTRADLVVAGVLKTGADTATEYPFGAFPYLLMEGAVNGYAETEAAVDQLHVLVNETLPAANFW